MQNKQTIIGWGLAGTTLAWEFYFNELTFEVFDNNQAHSTRTAAGLINPIVFRKQTKSWMADTLLPHAQNFYQKIEKLLNTQLLTNKNIFRVFASVEEENNWSAKQGDDRFVNYVKTPKNERLPEAGHVDYPYGMGEVETIGFLDTNVFIDASKAFFKEKGILFLNETFRYDRVKNEPATNFFFCEGVGLFNNPFFNYLPLKGTHGETIIIKTNDYTFGQVLNKNLYMLPLGNKLYKVGATYNWKLKTPVTTNEAKTDLTARLNAFTNFNYEVVDQKAGVRPTVTDRKPLTGTHPVQKNAHILNGLGTKGVMIAPFLAWELYQHVYSNHTLPTDASIERFQKFFSQQGTE